MDHLKLHIPSFQDHFGQFSLNGRGIPVPVGDLPRASSPQSSGHVKGLDMELLHLVIARVRPNGWLRRASACAHLYLWKCRKRSLLAVVSCEEVPSQTHLLKFSGSGRETLTHDNTFIVIVAWAYFILCFFH